MQLNDLPEALLALIFTYFTDLRILLLYQRTKCALIMRRYREYTAKEWSEISDSIRKNLNKRQATYYISIHRCNIDTASLLKLVEGSNLQYFDIRECRKLRNSYTSESCPPKDLLETVVLKHKCPILSSMRCTAMGNLYERFFIPFLTPGTTSSSQVPSNPFISPFQHLRCLLLNGNLNADRLEEFPQPFYFDRIFSWVLVSILLTKKKKKKTFTFGCVPLLYTYMYT
ncbi:hypothetical protein RFI_17897 [Reticulomyxa filosa]|uniref:F-box domain-containing protein n=1 Tax=Reticulomyxa filosa TaxID=46433 RepID=X6N0S0_RETFI|nr:hypothetical protein RFI_17897 [Reticulomyxa filosa]|eukprot:ETO19334.1 hypothetical protein RFI_17897 [Reticulomyxa filosa]